MERSWVLLQFLIVRNTTNPLISALFSSIAAEWMTLPEEKKANYIGQADKMKADYLEVEYDTEIQTIS